MLGALSSRTGKNTQLVLVCQILTAIVGFAINLLLLRKLSVENYGLFSLYSSIMMLLSGFLHLGWIETFVRFGSKHHLPEIFPALRAWLFKRVLSVAFVLSVIAWVSGPWVIERIYHRDGFLPLYRLAVASAFTTCVFTFSQADFRVRGEFWKYFVSQFGSSSARLVACFALFLAMRGLWPNEVAWVYGAVPFCFVLLWLWQARPVWVKSRVDSSIVREMWRYNSWILVSAFTTNIMGNVDSQFLAHYKSDEVLSAFGAAARLCLPVQFVISSLSTTMLPKLSAAKNQEQVRFYLVHMLYFLVPSAIALLAGVWLAPPVLIWLAGQKYAMIKPLIQLQMLCALATLITNPVSLVLYSWGQSHKLAIMNIAQFVVYLVLMKELVPTYGAEGALYSILAVNVIGLVYVCGAVGTGALKGTME